MNHAKKNPFPYRFCNHIDESPPQAFLSGGIIGIGGEGEAGSIDPPVLKPLEDLEAAELRHLEIQENAVIASLDSSLQRGFPVALDIDNRADSLEVGTQYHLIGKIILGDENPPFFKKNDEPLFDILFRGFLLPG